MCDSQEESQKSNYILLGYNCFHEHKKYPRGGGVCVFVKESFCCKIRQDLSINCDIIELLCLEITNRKLKNKILNLTYGLPNGEAKGFENQLNKILSINEILEKAVAMAGDFYMKLLDFEQIKNCKVLLVLCLNKA